MGAGIDYGSGRTNIDAKTGIRYGVISQNSVSQALGDSDLDYVYPGPNCPKCGRDAIGALQHVASDNAQAGYEHLGGCHDWQCDDCKVTFDSQDAYGEEWTYWQYCDDGYELSDCLDSGVIVTKSPYYTFAPYCSPCVPGACDLDSACDDGSKAYCLGHDWFEEREAPYPVYSVATGEQIFPAKYGKADY